MRRWTFNAIAALSLLLMLGAVGLWVDSYRYLYVGEYRWADGRVSLLSNMARTEVCLFFVEMNPGRTGWEHRRDTSGQVLVRVSDGMLYERYHRWGFGYAWAKPTLFAFGESESPRTGSISTLAVPHWFLALLLAILPAIWLRRWRDRIPPGHCLQCGYDLRASEERCPECGTEIPNHEAAGGPQ